MPAYTEEDLIQARRPHANRHEAGSAYCTLGHLETEQREAPTAERAAIITEVQGYIDAFDGVPPRTTATPTVPGVPVATPPTLPPTPTASALGELQAGIAAAQTSMERTLRRQGLTPASAGPSASGATTSSMHRTLRRMGLSPRA